MANSEKMAIGVVVERRDLVNPWQNESWHAIGVVPGAGEFTPWQVMARGDGWEHYHAGALELEVFPRETETLELNLTSGRPTVYVMLRPTPGGERPFALLQATACPGEAQAHHDTGDDIVDAVPMPGAVQAWLGDFVARNPPLRETRYKRQRDRADPESLAFGGRPGRARETDDE